MTFFWNTINFCAKENVPKSAVYIWYDHYEFLVMPFGLTNTPLVFMDLMNQAFHGYLDIWVAECTVDTLVYSTSLVEHGRHLISVLEVLRKRDFSQRLRDVSFGWGSVIFGLCNERECTHSQNNRTRTHNCTCALITQENYWLCGLHIYITIGGDAPLCNNKDIAYATYQLWIRSSVVLLMVRKW